MERETRTLTTPLGKELKLKTYLTARERNELRDIYLKNTKINVGKDATVSEGLTVDASILTESQNLLIKVVTVKYGEETNPETILNLLLESKPEEYDFVVEESGKTEGNLTQAK